MPSQLLARIEDLEAKLDAAERRAKAESDRADGIEAAARDALDRAEHWKQAVCRAAGTHDWSKAPDLILRIRRERDAAQRSRREDVEAAVRRYAASHPTFKL